ncbi:MAG: hypothetical protein AAF623_00120 [Planctomycetota bacterium]
MRTTEKAPAPLPTRRDFTSTETAADNSVLLALAPVQDQTMGDSLRTAVQKTKQQIDQRAAELLAAFMESLANRD